MATLRAAGGKSLPTGVSDAALAAVYEHGRALLRGPFARSLFSRGTASIRIGGQSSEHAFLASTDPDPSGVTLVVCDSVAEADRYFHAVTVEIHDDAGAWHQVPNDCLEFIEPREPAASQLRDLTGDAWYPLATPDGSAGASADGACLRLAAIAGALARIGEDGPPTVQHTLLFGDAAVEVSLTVTSVVEGSGKFQGALGWWFVSPRPVVFMFAVGPAESTEGPITFFAVTRDGRPLDMAEASLDFVSSIVRRHPRLKRTCAPELADSAGRLDFEVVPWTADRLADRAAIAAVLANPRLYELSHGLVHRMLRVVARLATVDCTGTWTLLRGEVATIARISAQEIVVHVDGAAWALVVRECPGPLGAQIAAYSGAAVAPVLLPSSPQFEAEHPSDADVLLLLELLEQVTEQVE